MLNTYSTAIVFGTGPLGCSVAEELLKKNVTVRMYNRSGKANVPDGVKLGKADVTDPELCKDICSDAEVIFHCASPPYTSWAQLFPSITYGIMNGAIAAGAKLVYGDNLYPYGVPDSKISEDLPYKTIGHKAKVRAEMAERLIEKHRQGDLEVVIGRASDFYGPRVLNSVLGERVFKNAIEGKTLGFFGNLDMPHTYTYIKDFAKGLVILSEHSNAYGKVWNIPSAETLTTRQLFALILKETKTNSPMKATPKFIINLLSIFNPIVKELKEVLPAYENPYVVDHSKFERMFGNHSTPHEKAISETVNWYKQTFYK